MKKKFFTILALFALSALNGFTQETLQTVTDRGNSSNNRIIINPIYQFGSRMTTYGAGSGYFDIYNNSNSSISLALKRSDGASVFEIDGHSMNSFFGGRVGIGTTAPDQMLTVKGGIGFDHNSSDKKLYSPIDGVLEWMTHNAAGEHAFSISHQGNKAIYFNTNGNSYLNGGNVGIGVVNPDYKLQVTGGVTGISNTTTDWHVGSSGSVINISNGSNTGNTYGMINVLKAGGGAWDNLVLQNGSGNVGIGTTDPKGYKLAVAGNMIAESVKVSLQTNWPDYVFAKDYQLPTLQETEKDIKNKGHLPGIPSAADVKANGVDLGEMNAKLLQKIEELTLHLIEREKRDTQQQLQIEQLQKQITAILVKDK